MADERIAIGRWLVVFVIVVVTVMILSTAIYSVPAGHVGVHDLFGVVDKEELQPGLHIKNPFAHIEIMSVQTQEYTMSIVSTEGQKKGSDTIAALTKEGLSIDLDITVLYSLDQFKANDVYKTIGKDYVNVIVRPQIRTAIRDVVAKYEAKDVYSDKRYNVSFEIFNEISELLELKGILLEKVLLRNVNLPTQLTTAIEDKLTAEQNIEKKAFEVQVESEEANRKRVEAQGIADSQTIIDESLTSEYLTWYWIENLKNHESVIYVPVGEGGLPIFKGIN